MNVSLRSIASTKNRLVFLCILGIIFAFKQARIVQVLQHHNSTTSPNLKAEPKNCAYLFFGLPREFKTFVLPSINRNIIRVNPQCDIFIHTYNVSSISNGRNGEFNATIDITDVYMLSSSISKTHLQIETIESFERTRNLTFYREHHHKDWGTYTPTDNMIKQWHSINAAWNMMEQKEREMLQRKTQRNHAMAVNGTYPSKVYYEHVGLFRLDVIFVTPINIFDSNAAVPDFAHHHGGVNDRLFYGQHEYAKIFATTRFDSVHEYLQSDRLVQNRDFGLHSEYFVGWLLRQKYQIPLEMKDICVWRTRSFPLKILTFDCEILCGKAMQQLYADLASDFGVPLERQEEMSTYHEYLKVNGCPRVQHSQCYRYIGNEKTRFTGKNSSSAVRSHEMMNRDYVARISSDNAHRVEPCTIQRNISFSYVPKNAQTKNFRRRGSLYLITPTNQPAFLSQSVFHVIKLKACFDVKWIIVHTVADSRLYRAPFFRNRFPWITELRTYHNQSRNGNHERNVGIQHVINDSRCDLDLVYFLDDDNILPDNICNEENLRYLSSDQLITAKQFRTDGQTHTLPGMCWNASHSGLRGNVFTDSGAWLLPVHVLKQFNETRWILNDYAADSHFFTNLILSLVNISSAPTVNTNVVVELPHFAFNYNALHESKKPSIFWDKKKLNHSLYEYRNLVHLIEGARNGLSEDHKMTRPEVSFHDFVHVLYNIREAMSVPEATYVEIGVWKGGTSIFMSRHPKKTNVIGIDGFFFDKQYDEAVEHRKAFQGQGSIDFIRGDSKTSVPALKELLNGRSISILFIDGDHSFIGVLADFDLYEPLVADGGYIIFDDFMDTTYSGGVREAVMRMIYDNIINLDKYNVIGSIPNIVGAGSIWSKEDPFFYDWQHMTSNEFILQKKEKV